MTETLPALRTPSSPSTCPCCGLTCFQCRFKQTKNQHWEHWDDGNELWCEACNTWFMWRENGDDRTGTAIVIETWFPRGRLGNRGEIVNKKQKIYMTEAWNPVQMCYGEEEQELRNKLV